MATLLGRLRRSSGCKAALQVVLGNRHILLFAVSGSKTSHPHNVSRPFLLLNTKKVVMGVFSDCRGYVDAPKSDLVIQVFKCRTSRTLSQRYSHHSDSPATSQFQIWRLQQYLTPCFIHRHTGQPGHNTPAADTGRTDGGN